MSAIPRITQQIFAGSASNNGQFGSAQAGTKVTTSSIATIMNLSAWAQGWLDAVIGASNFPALEEFQGVDYVHSTQIAYILQRGIPEYDSGTTYFNHCVVLQPGTFNVYGSIIDNNTGNALTDPSSWKLLQNLAQQAGAVYNGASSTAGTANAQTLTTTAGTWTNIVQNLCFFTAGVTNTGAMTLNIDSIGAVSVKKEGSSGLINLVAGDITNGQSYSIVSNGAVYVLQSSFNPSAFLQVANNLSDVANAATALGNLGGLAKSANLSDVANPATSLANLGGIGNLFMTSGAVQSLAVGFYNNGTSQTSPYAVGSSYSAATLQSQGLPWQGSGPNVFPYSTGTWLCLGLAPCSVGGWGGFENFLVALFQRTA